MKEKSFKPQLAPNEKVDLSTLNYPLLASTKLDGIRCIIKEGEIVSRSLKQIQCKQLRERLEPLRKFSEENNVIFDGEIYSSELSFQAITHFVMTQDLGDEQLPEHVKFYCFDAIKNNNFTQRFDERLIYNVFSIENRFSEIMVVVKNKIVQNQEEVQSYFDEVLSQGYEGLILRDPKAFYKFGRGTVKEGIIFKVKPFLDFDGQIIDVIQATEVNEDAEKKINELGRSVTSKKKGERHTIEKASAFMVKYEGKDLKVVLSMTDEEKEEVWNNRDSYLGRWISYKGMLVGSKDVPRHPVMLRFREPK